MRRIINLLINKFKKMDTQTEGTGVRAEIKKAAVEIKPIAEKLKAKMSQISVQSPEEFRDTIEDFLTIVVIGDRALRDGFQWVNDTVNLLQAQPLIQEIVQDIPVFIS